MFVFLIYTIIIFFAAQCTRESFPTGEYPQRRHLAVFFSGATLFLPFSFFFSNRVTHTSACQAHAAAFRSGSHEALAKPNLLFLSFFVLFFLILSLTLAPFSRQGQTRKSVRRRRQQQQRRQQRHSSRTSTLLRSLTRVEGPAGLAYNRTHTHTHTQSQF